MATMSKQQQYLEELKINQVKKISPEVLYYINKNKKSLERKIAINSILITGVIFFICMVLSMFTPIDF